MILFMKDKELSITEELDFQYLLQLLPPLEGEADFAWLPELFSIIGAEKLITLCKYAGGETIKIPTIEQLTKDIEALQWYYDVYISKKKYDFEIPEEFKELVQIIKRTYD
jgi:hypothetical protein